jgi:hypothetical protein
MFFLTNAQVLRSQRGRGRRSTYFFVPYANCVGCFVFILLLNGMLEIVFVGSRILDFVNNIPAREVQQFLVLNLLNEKRKSLVAN